MTSKQPRQPHKTSSSSVIARYCTPRSTFLLCASIIYVIVVGTQFKLARIISNFNSHDAHLFSGGGLTSSSLSVTPSEETLLKNGRVLKNNVVSQPLSSSSTSQRLLVHTLSTQIATRWNLTTPHAIPLLERQFAKPHDYDPQRDFFHFHHLYKSGGTSMSDLMDKTIGMPKVGNYYEGILPGSYRSGDLDHDEALKDITKRLQSGTKREDLPYKAAYAHTGLRPVYGPQATKTGKFYLEHFPHRRLRVVTMLRDPVDFRASNHAMIMCGLNHEVEVFNRQRVDRGLEKICSPAEGLNISALIDVKIQGILAKCDMEAKDPQKKIPARQQQCQKERRGIDTLKHCRSAANLLNDPQYEKHYRSMFKGVMGRFHRGQSFGGTAYGRMGYGYESAELSDGYSVQAVEQYTLEDLGGLDLTISGAGDGIGEPEPDFIWFGITERMKESVVLFYYTFRLRPAKRVPDARVQDCRPTSWWTEEDKAIVKEREPADYALWRAANAIVDVRMEKLKMEVKAKLEAGETKESLFYVDWDQLEELGITF
eukprot:CCRYP_009630-RA/>CCRYP_009630-RA protein AED:0.01 eAED:0.01 QI:108/1/1/1/1/1/2/2426/539